MKRVTGLIITIVMIVMLCVPAFAENTTQIIDGSASEQTAKCTVTAGIVNGGAYKVKLPATLKLDEFTEDWKYKGTYQVAAQGIISSGKEIYIEPVTPFTMKSSSGSDEATVTQTIKKWKKTADASSLAISKTAWADTTGTVIVDLTHDDLYSGSLLFKYGMRNSN